MGSGVLKTKANTPSANDLIFNLNFDYIKDNNNIRGSDENCD